MTDKQKAQTPQLTTARLLVVTDLDGTLLDHHSYSYQAAVPALQKLRARHFPLILASSKTRAEILQLRSELGNQHPFIVENGAAICGVQDEFPNCSESELVLGRPYGEIIAILQALRHRLGLGFEGFNDMSAEQVAQCTGLPLGAAVLAKAREYSEPLIWHDDEASKVLFLEALAAEELSAQQGGRFLTVSGLSNKGRAVETLRSLYCGSSYFGSSYCGDVPVQIIALGDSPNDQSMLDAADIAVIVKSANSHLLQVTNPRTIIHTEERGPLGWNRALINLLED